jgi:hypothetical protein
MIAIKLSTTNDANGNPRRCYVVLHDGVRFGVPTGYPGIEAVIDEGYEGIRALRDAYPSIVDTAAEFDVPVREYNDLLDRYGE